MPPGELRLAKSKNNLKTLFCYIFMASRLVTEARLKKTITFGARSSEGRKIINGQRKITENSEES